MSFALTPPTTPGNVGLGISVVIHIGLMILIIFGLPKRELPPAPPPPIIVDLVAIGEKTQSTVKAPRDQIAKKVADTVSPPPPPKPADTKPVEPEKKPEPVKKEPDKVEPAKPEPVKEKVEKKPVVEKSQPKKEEPKPVPPPAPTLKEKPVPTKVEPKPATPKPVEKAEKKPIKKVKDSPDFSEMIRKSIKENKSKSLASGAGQQATAGTRDLGDVLTISQMDAVRQHISRCWNVAAIQGAPGLEKIRIDTKLTMQPNRTVKSLTITGGEGRSSPYYNRMVETIERAFERPACQQLPLPPGNYAKWKEFKLKFSLAEMLGY